MKANQLKRKLFNDAVDLLTGDAPDSGIQILPVDQIKPFHEHPFRLYQGEMLAGHNRQNAARIRHVLYNCAASRPGIEGKTNEDTREVQTETLTIKATPLSSGLVKAKTGNTTDTIVYNDWYKAVYMPVVAEDDEGGVA